MDSTPQGGTDHVVAAWGGTPTGVFYQVGGLQIQVLIKQILDFPFQLGFVTFTESYVAADNIALAVDEVAGGHGADLVFL